MKKLYPYYLLARRWFLWVEIWGCPARGILMPWRLLPHCPPGDIGTPLGCSKVVVWVLCILAAVGGSEWGHMMLRMSWVSCTPAAGCMCVLRLQMPWRWSGLWRAVGATLIRPHPCNLCPGSGWGCAQTPSPCACSQRWRAGPRSRSADSWAPSPSPGCWHPFWSLKRCHP